jgi:hypothetical protein
MHTSKPLHPTRHTLNWRQTFTPQLQDANIDFKTLH